VALDAVTAPQLIQAAVDQIEHGTGTEIFGHHNLHSLHLFNKLPQMQRFYAKCQLTHIDGMSLVLLGKMLGLPLDRSHRTTYLDWIEDFLAVANQRGWKLYIAGGTSEVAAALPALLHERYPNLQVCTHHGYVTAEDDQSLTHSIADFAPHILMVGMGMPHQEKWILRNLPSLNMPIVFSCGAAFEYLVGVKQRPPRWVGQLGLEWLFRLLTEPRRLASRYLVEPLHLLPLFSRALFARLRGDSSLSNTRTLP
jgi:N-acetylglucosaminyldiphosphoundecaprenol N-acetyl-beta-D-mannosaminyltransferase